MADRLKISLDIDFDNYEQNLQNLNKALERLSKSTNLDLDIKVNNTTTEELNKVNEAISKVNDAILKINTTKINFGNGDIASQIEKLNKFSGTIGDIKNKLSSLGTVKIKSNSIDTDGIESFVASINDAKGKVTELQYVLNDTLGGSEKQYTFEGIKSVTDSTDKAIRKLDEFKEKWIQIANEIEHQDLLPNNAIGNIQKSLNNLTLDNSKLDFDKIKRNITDLRNEANKLFTEQQTNLQKVIKFVDEYNQKINSLYRNNNGGLKNEEIMGLENKVQSLVGTSDISQFNNIQQEYISLIEKQKDYQKQIDDENQKLKEQEDLLKYISSQQERLKNIQSNFSTKIDTNTGYYGNLQNQYKNIFDLLDEYKEKGEQLTAEQKINVTEQINDLKRLTNEYLNVNSFIKSQENELNNLGSKYKTVLQPDEITKYINALKGFDPETNNLIGDMNKVIEKHKELKNELQERLRVQNLGENIGSLSGSGLNMDSGIKDVEKYIQSVLGTKASVSSVKNSVDALGNAVKVANVSLNEGHNIVSKYKIALDQTSDSVRKLSLGEQDLSSRHAGLAESIGAALSGFLKFQVIAMGVMEAINALKEGISTINSLNEKMSNIAMVTGESMQTVQGYMNQYTQLATQMHTTTDDIAISAENFLRAGKTNAESMQMVKAAIVMSKEAGISEEESSEGLIAISNAYGILPNKIMNVVDMMTKLDNVSSSSVSEMNTALTKTASSANEAGVPLNKLLSYITEISSVTRTNPSTIGTGLNSIFSRFSSIKMGKNYDVNSGEEISLNNVEKSLKTVGIAIRSDKDTFKSFSDVLDQLGEKWGNLNSRQKNLIATNLAGKMLAPLYGDI